MSATATATKASARSSRRRRNGSGERAVSIAAAAAAGKQQKSGGRTLRSATTGKSDPFAHLPPYSPPSTGLVSRLPAGLIPYAELMRLHKPAGYYAFYFPHVFGTLFAAARAGRTVDPTAVAATLALHIVSNLVLRGAACTYNDALDAPYDRQVARCRHRPVARGAVSPAAAQTFAAAQTVAWVAVLHFLMPRECHVPALLFAATMVLYPFCKRFTNFPQVVLGFSLALGQSIGAASAGLDPFGSELVSGTRRAMLCLYLSNVVNAIIYDTVYAHQDLKDDLKAGVMSMAVACNGRTKEVLSVLGAVEIALLVAAGQLAGFGPLYWAFGVAGTVITLVAMIVTADLENPADCWRWFKWLIWLTGATLSAGLAGEYAARIVA